MCDDKVGTPEADVICRMLGYPHGSQTTWQGKGDLDLGRDSFIGIQVHSFGHGSGSILLDDLDCTGNEDSVVQCKHRGWGVNDCVDDGANHEWLGITCLVNI